jgi:ABC-type dipeptide transport system, periplasmic component
MKSLKKAIAVIAALIMAMMVFAGCNTTKPAAEEEPTGPKVLKLYLSNGASLDPHTWTWGGHFDRMGIFEGLTKLDNNFKAIPGNAEKWEHNADYTVWTFHLRKNLKWSDGTALTAKDFEYSFKRAIDPNNFKGQTPAYNKNVLIKNAEEVRLGKAKAEDLGVKAKDDYTLEVTLSKGSADFDASVAENWALPVPKQVIDKSGADWWKPANIVTNGPYKVKEWENNAKLVIVPNDKYYGKANFEEITVLTSTGNQLLAYQNGDINIANLAFSDMDLVNKDPVLSKEVQTFKSGVDFYAQLLKSENDILQKNVKVRQAIAMSIDKEKIAKDIMLNTIRAGKSLVPEIYASWGNDIGLKYDQAKAKQLMTEAGFPDGKGFPTITLLVSGNPDSRLLAVQDMIQKGTGLKVEFKSEEWASFSKDINKYWDKNTIGYFISGTGSSVNSYTGYFGDLFDVAVNELDAAAAKEYIDLANNTKMDAGERATKQKELVETKTTENGKKYKDLLKQADAEIDPAKKEAKLKEAATLRENEACTFCIDWENGVKLVKPGLKGYVGNPTLLGTPPLYWDSLSMGSAKK